MTLFNNAGTEEKTYVLNGKAWHYKIQELGLRVAKAWSIGQAYLHISRHAMDPIVKHVQNGLLSQSSVQ